MLIEKVLTYPTRILNETERSYYFANGCVRIERLISNHWLDRIKTASAKLIEQSREVTESNNMFLLETGHSAQTPRLKRLISPVSHHPDFWSFASNSEIVDAVADVVGPDVRFYHSKLNYKWAGGGQRFDWHQDIQAWPHTNYSPVTVGVLLEDTTLEQGPLIAVKGSHKGELYDLYDDEDNFVIRIDQDKLGWVTEELKEYMTGPAGTIFLLNCRTIHGSTKNNSSRSRPLLLNVYSAADAFPYVSNPIPSPFDGAIVQGEAARWSHHDPRPCQIPPDWSQGYSGPWAHQGRGTS